MINRKVAFISHSFLVYVLLIMPVRSEELIIYHDADYSNHRASAEFMAMGFNTALDEVGHQVQGYRLKLIPKDHHGNMKRSKRHMKSFIKDPNALMVLGGLHSPPYIANRSYINENEVLLMVPWAAGGPITRYADGKNWVFRVSVDDTKAGMRIAEHAVESKGCRRPHLLLENTAWGHSNRKSISRALAEKGFDNVGVTWFEWNLQENESRIVLRDILSQNSDCLLFVGNAIEGKVFSKGMASLSKDMRVPIISHWGITGGDFNKVYREDMHGEIDLSFLQTCFSFLSSEQSKLSEGVVQRAKRLHPKKIQKPSDISPPPGFIHAYDTARIMLAALNQITLTGDVKKNRSNLRDALESIDVPVDGLVKKYNPPFTPWLPNNSDAHEALGLEDLCMASYDKEGLIRLLRDQK